MSGHSKWANTKHRKAEQDIKKGRIFTKIIRELVNTARLGGGDPSTNPRLRAAIDKALSNNMTRDTMNRAIVRGINCNENIENVVYEGYGPGGVAIMINCLSKNRKHTTAELSSTFIKYGGNLGSSGSTSYLFSKKGVISFKDGDENIIMEAALEAGAEDVIIHDNGKIDIYTIWEKIKVVNCALESVGLKPDNIEVLMIPSIKKNIDKENKRKLLILIDSLKNFNYVQEISHNCEIFENFYNL